MVQLKQRMGGVAGIVFLKFEMNWSLDPFEQLVLMMSIFGIGSTR